MFRTKRSTRLAILFAPLAAFLLLAAAPVRADTPDELIRRANELFRAGDTVEADKLYIAAEERTADPGLVAYNRAAILFERGQFREAEVQYERVLDDAACPPERAAKAWYNRGTCLLHRGGSTSVYRSAIACFENSLDNTATDRELKQRAEHNLELAKLRWLEAAKQEKKPDPPSPNDNVPQEENKQPKHEPERTNGGQDMTTGNDTGGTPKNGKQPVPEAKDGKQTPKTNDQNVPANNANLEVLQDKDEVQKLSPDDARARLKDISKRRKRELHSLLESLYGPDRVDVRDW